MTPVQGAGISIRLRRRFFAPRERVFRAWTLAETLKQWWCPDGWATAEVEIDLRAGGAYRIGMRRLDGGPPVYVHGCFLEVCSPEKLVYTWNWENAFAQMPETRVTVQFSESDGITDVLLLHESLPDIAVCLQHRNGWIAAWARIERNVVLA